MPRRHSPVYARDNYMNRGYMIEPYMDWWLYPIIWGQYSAAMQYAKQYIDQYGMNGQIASQIMKISESIKGGNGNNGFVQ